MLEYCHGGDLKTKLSNPNIKISFEQKLNWLIQIFGAVLYLHNRNIVHRDLKTQNILLTKDNICKLCDFGLSKFMEKASQKMTTAVGTSYYMAVSFNLFF